MHKPMKLYPLQEPLVGSGFVSSLFKQFPLTNHMLGLREVLDALSMGKKKEACRGGRLRSVVWWVVSAQLAPAQRGELTPEALWAEHGELLDSSEEVRIRVRALDAKIDALQASLDALLSALPPDAAARVAASSARHQARPSPPLRSPFAGG